MDVNVIFSIMVFSPFYLIAGVFVTSYVGIGYYISERYPFMVATMGFLLYTTLILLFPLQLIYFVVVKIIGGAKCLLVRLKSK